jgi:DNA-binding winged helix-turn-helix (wHTH) protein
MRMNQPFVLNNRFVVNPALNSLNDQIMGQDTRLEPRLMNVLCFLAVNAGQLVSRQQLIKEVWNDYGGADEGLNQVISFLRKLLDDPDKKIIKTIPTKGYLLNATITDTFITEGKTTNETSLKTSKSRKITGRSLG